jgi:4-diphosphocytidyl-2-C-methyl-D-erythritol kinase
MADRLVVPAPAKLNLVLRVGPRASDGYHPLASLMMALAGLGDEVSIAKAHRRTLSCPGAPEGPANLAWRAVDALEAACRRPLPARIAIVKRIPIQAGLGGGSSDAAAVLIGMDALYGLGLGTTALERLAADLGSDVPFFIRGGTQWATGRGERLVPQPLPDDLFAVICGPVASLATAQVYRAFDRLETGRAIDPTPPESPWATGGWVANDLWPAARVLAPGLDAAAADLARLGAHAVLLCGSGGAIAGLWTSQDGAESAAACLPSAIAVTWPHPARARTA